MEFFKKMDKSALRTVMFRFLLFGLPLVVLSDIGLSLLYNSRLETLILNMEKQQEELVILDEFYYEAMFKGLNGDLRLIENSDEFSRYLSERSEGFREEAEQMFFRFLQNKSDLRTLRYISAEGRETIKAEKRDGGISVSGREDLGDISGLYYFRSIRGIGPGEMYVSDFDLTGEGGAGVPIIRFALKIIHGGETEGYLIADVDGQDILDLLRSFQENKSSSIELGLIDNNHFISSGFPGEPGLAGSSAPGGGADFERVYALIDSGEKRGRIEYGEYSYFYNLIGLERADFSIRYDERGGPWAIISRFDRNRLLREEGGPLLRLKHLWIPNTLFLSGIVLAILIFFKKRESEHLLFLASGIVSDFSHDGIMITDSRKRVIYCNPIFENLFGYSLEEMRGRKPHDFLRGGPPAVPEEEKGTDEILWEGNIWDISRDDIHIQRYLRLRTVNTSDGRIAYYIGIYSEPKILSIAAERGKSEIPGTFLNRDSLDYLTPQLYNCEMTEGGKRTAVIIIRITEFAILRNKLTENEENTLISRLSTLLKRNLDTDSLVFAPTSGLLFLAVTLTELTPLEGVMERIDRAVTSMRFADSSCTIQYLSGVAISPEHGTDGRDLVENAYMALEAITRIKAVKYLLFNQNIYETVNRYHRIKGEIETAYRENEFSVVYQPQNDVATGRISGMEALIRWNNKTLGSVPPYQFIPVMEEEPTQIKRLGKHILAKVIGECLPLLPLVGEDFRISVNLSAQEFADTGLVGDLIQMVGQSRCPFRNICFEITETVLSENLEQTNTVIDMLHRNGITVAIDDFGTGYSSLGYLKQLKSDKLKVDRMFIKDYPEQDDGSILKAIVKLSHELGVKVIVEGIETEEQLSFIGGLGCQEFQGYLSSKPVPVGEIEKILRP